MSSTLHWPARTNKELEASVERDVVLCKQNTQNFLGYPRNLLVDNFVLQQTARLSEFHIHNVGDYKAGSRYPLQAFDKEVMVVNFFKMLWRCGGNEDEFWAYVTANGTEGNLWGGYVGMRVLTERVKREPVIICSKEAHYSFDKASAMGRLELELVAANQDGSINIGALKQAFEKHQDKPILLALMNGTTVKEGRDNIPAALKAFKDTGRPRNQIFVHVDAAYSGVYLPLVNASAAITPGFHHDIDSISASGHKFIGTSTTCGVILMRREHSDIVSKSVEYIASKDKTLGGSRDAHVIYELWLRIERLGTDMLREWAVACIAKAQEMAQKLRHAGLDVLLNPHATTVYFPKPSDRLIKKYHLACQGDFAHAICAPHTLGKEFGGHDTANRFLNEYLEELRDGSEECLVKCVG